MSYTIETLDQRLDDLKRWINELRERIHERNDDTLRLIGGLEARLDVIEAFIDGLKSK